MISLLVAAALAATPNAAVTAPPDLVTPATAVGDADLQAVRGGSAPLGVPSLPSALDSAISTQNLSGEVTGNSVAADTVNSGAINFNGQALSGFSGIGNFILNTGMNSLLQGSVSVTVNLVGAP